MHSLNQVECKNLMIPIYHKTELGGVKEKTHLYCQSVLQADRCFQIRASRLCPIFSS